MLNSLWLMLGFALAQTDDVAKIETITSKYFPPNLFLVRAHTDDVRKAAPRREIGTFVIKHAYAGSLLLNGKTFECSTSSPLGGLRIRTDNYRHVAHLEKDTDTLWWLYLDKENKLRPELRAEVVDTYWIRAFPLTNGRFSTAWEITSGDRQAAWKEGLAWAEAIETVYKSKSDKEREALLRRLAATEQSPIAAWAINLLGKVNPEGTMEFLKTLATNDKLSAAAHVVLDNTLTRLDYPHWRSEDHWERLLTHWVASPDLVYYNAGMQRLWELGQSSEINFALYVKILGPVLAKADQLNEGQEKMLGGVLECPPTFPFRGRDKAFDWLAGQVRSGKTPFVREHAAKGLRVFGQLNPIQRELVTRLRDRAEDVNVQQALDVVLRSK